MKLIALIVATLVTTHAIAVDEAPKTYRILCAKATDQKQAIILDGTIKQIERTEPGTTPQDFVSDVEGKLRLVFARSGTRYRDINFAVNGMERQGVPTPGRALSIRLKPSGVFSLFSMSAQLLEDNDGNRTAKIHYIPAQITPRPIKPLELPCQQIF